MLQYEMEIDDETLSRYGRQLMFNKRAGLRIDRRNAHLANAIENKAVSDESWVTREQLRDFDAACTKWCSETFFPDAYARLTMVLNMCKLYERVRKLTGLKFRIMFKGGVMMRLVLLEFLKNFSEKGKADVKQYMDEHKALSLSDFDFEIVPDNHESTESSIISLFALDYAVLLWFQGELGRERDGIVPARLLNMDWDAEERTEDLTRKLESVAKGLPSTHPMHRAKIDRVVLSSEDDRPPKGYVTKNGKSTTQARNNVVIFECNANRESQRETCVLNAHDYFRYLRTSVATNTGGSCFYATLNTFIGENEVKKTPSHMPGLFHLSRIKHGFVMYYTTKDGNKRCDRLSGEIIDLSQSAGNERDELRHFLYTKVKTPYRSYPILGVDPSVAALRSYTPEAFFIDLQTQVHNVDSAPWNAGGKTPKRMVRYVAFAVMHLMSPYVSGTFEEKTNSLERTLTQIKLWKQTRTFLAPAKTGSQPLDEFLERERKTLVEHKGDLTKKISYLAQLASHIEIFLHAAVADDFNIFHVQEESELVMHSFIRAI